VRLAGLGGCRCGIEGEERSGRCDEIGKKLISKGYFFCQVSWRSDTIIAARDELMLMLVIILLVNRSGLTTERGSGQANTHKDATKALPIRDSAP